jgi:hypothetical protein
MSESEQIASQEHQRRLRHWIGTIENRIVDLLDFEISELTAAEREVAASRLMVTMGRMIELEQQLAQTNDPTTVDEVKTIAALIGIEIAS